MKKKNYKSLSHWLIMTAIFGGPLIATFGSVIPKNYKNNDEYTYVNVEDFKQGHEYRFIMTNSNPNAPVQSNVYFIEVKGLYFDTTSGSTNQANRLTYNTTFKCAYIGTTEYYNKNGYVDLIFNYATGNIDFLKQYAYEKVRSVDNDLGKRTYNAMLDFANMPINNWYLDLCNVTIGKPNGYNVVSVLKLYPLFALWVVGFDLIYDCISMIPKVAHTWLDKVNKENE